jgi:hypothetical protein
MRVDFDDDIAADERERIEESIRTMAQHSVERRDAQREVDADADALRDTVGRRLNQLIDADSEEMSAAIARHRRYAEQLHQRDRLEFPVVRAQDLVFDFSAGARSLQVFGVPFHFLWHWSSGLPAPEELPLLDRPNGFIGLTDNTGQTGDRRVSHHAGFGVSLSTDRPKNITARSLRRTAHSYWLSTFGFDGSATAEGGTEMTVMENGTLLRSAVDKVFRKRCSSGENDYVDPDGFATGSSIEMSWTMLPGSRYEFNVGAWVYCETDQSGLEGDNNVAGARMQALVIAMTIDEN